MSERKKVLIVDDLEVNRAILAQIFTEDYDIIEAEDGIKAIEMIEEYDNNHNNTEEASTRHTIEISKETNKKANEKSNKKEKCCH